MNYDVYLMTKKMIMQAKKDLCTGVNEDMLDKMLEKNFIDKDTYLDIKNELRALQQLAYNPTSEDMINSYEIDNISYEKLFDIESNIIATFLNFESWSEWLDEYYKINPKSFRNKNLTSLQETEIISRRLGYDGWKDFFENFPYPQPQDKITMINALEDTKYIEIQHNLNNIENNCSNNKNFIIIMLGILLIIIVIAFIYKMTN